MKIFYAIQATGNGHISRAMEIMPYLEQYGQVDVFLSGSNSNLTADLPVKYQSKGVSLFYGNKGGLDYLKMLQSFNPVRAWKEAKDLPVEQYDIIINDFESITSLACKIKNIPSVNFGHQASFNSPQTPRPTTKDWMGECILKNYASATASIGLHFERYDDFIFQPIIKNDILSAQPANIGHVTVYLSHYNDAVVAQSLQHLTDVHFHVFSKKVTTSTTKGNITFMPISKEGFNQSMINSYGVITGAGFETPAEALYLGKKVLCLPIKGQYEQLCNAAALHNFNVPIINKIDEFFGQSVQKWLEATAPKPLHLEHSTYQIVQHVIETARNLRTSKTKPTGNLVQQEDFLVLR